MPDSSSQTFLRELDKKLWTAAVSKHAVLGLIFLTYVSDSFAQRQAEIEAMLRDPDMWVNAGAFINHGGTIGDIMVFGQESNPTTWRLAAMNMAIRGIDFDKELADTFTRTQHPDLRADLVRANPPLNDSDWFRKSMTCAGSSEESVSLKTS